MGPQKNIWGPIQWVAPTRGVSLRYPCSPGERDGGEKGRSPFSGTGRLCHLHVAKFSE